MQTENNSIISLKERLYKIFQKLFDSKPSYSESFNIAKYASKPNDSNPITLFSEKESGQSWVHLLDWTSSDDGFVTLRGQGIKPNTDNPSPRDNTFIQIIIDNNPTLGSTTSSGGEGQWVQCIMPIPKGKLISFMAHRLQHGHAYFIRAIERERERERRLHNSLFIKEFFVCLKSSFNSLIQCFLGTSTTEPSGSVIKRFLPNPIITSILQSQKSPTTGRRLRHLVTELSHSWQYHQEFLFRITTVLGMELRDLEQRVIIWDSQFRVAKVKQSLINFLKTLSLVPYTVFSFPQLGRQEDNKNQLGVVL